MGEKKKKTKQRLSCQLSFSRLSPLVLVIFIHLQITLSVHKDNNNTDFTGEVTPKYLLHLSQSQFAL